MQTIKEVNPHLCIVPCVNMRSVLFSVFLLILLLLVELLVHGSITFPGVSTKVYSHVFYLKINQKGPNKVK